MIRKLVRDLVSYGQKTFLGYETEVLTFSQAGEDLVIRNFFYDRLSRGDKGFYVDIGAFHPYRHSNTYYLYRAGWRGLNIDARPGSMKQFDALRPGDINVEIAISDKEGYLPYFEIEGASGMNSMSEEYIKKLGNTDGVKATRSIRTLPLSEILSTHVPPGTSIDLMSIDIEGLEEKALSSNNWEKFRPKLIACEIYGFSMNEIARDPVSALLFAQGYQIFARLNLAMPNVNTVFFVEQDDGNGN